MDNENEPNEGMVQADSFSSAPDEAIQTLEESPDQELILDLDLTLVLGPTTEAFLDSVRPSSFAAMLLSAFDKLAPWRFLPGSGVNRDWVRVLLILIFMPWSYFLWRSTAKSWTQNNTNHKLVDAVRKHSGPAVVATRGFSFIVRPVVAALQLKGEQGVPTVACKVAAWRGLRQISKVDLINRSSHVQSVANALVVSDSADDYELFAASKTPVLTEWEGAYWINPQSDAYIPLRYVQRTKQPPGLFVKVGLVVDDLYIALLALSVTVTAWAIPIHALGVVLFSVAMWITYETGYYENDMVGAVKETDPSLPTNFAEVKGTVPKYAPWVWALCLTILGSPLIVLGSSEAIGKSFLVGVIWMGVLFVVRLLFAIFNRLPKVHRVIPHLGLQVGKYLGYGAVTAVTPVGWALLISQVAYRWVPYIPYRWSKDKRFPEQQFTRTRLFVFIALAVPSLVFIERPTIQIVLFVLAVLFLVKRSVPNWRAS